MQFHARSGLLIPDGRKIDYAWNISRLWWMNKRLLVCGPGLHSPWPKDRQPTGLRINKIKTLLQLENFMAKPRNHGNSINQPFNKVHLRLLRQNFFHHVAGGKTLIRGRHKQVEEKFFRVL